MRAALVVPRIVPDRDANLQSLKKWIARAAEARAELAVFPETALTGIVNTDDPDHDLALGEPVPGLVTAELGSLARRHDIFLALGLFERAGKTLFDSAVLLAPDGDIALHYRRIQPGWHGPRADGQVYGHGSEIPLAPTPLGTFAFLLCGDLFSNDLTDRVRALEPDWLLVPFARSFEDGSHDQARWEREELPEYGAQIRRAGAPAFLVNYLGLGELGDGVAFGGVTAFDREGRVVASHPLGEEGLIAVDLPRPE